MKAGSDRTPSWKRHVMARQTLASTQRLSMIAHVVSNEERGKLGYSYPDCCESGLPSQDITLGC